MNKLYRYNQVVIAISGSLAAVALAISLVFISFELLRSLFPAPNTSILSQDEQSKLTSKHIRRQVVSVNSIFPLDSSGEYSVLPVAQVNLKKDQKVLESRWCSMDGGSFSGSGLYRQTFRGPYNNVIVRNNVLGEAFFVFQKRISISEFYSLSVNGSYFLLLVTQLKDSNHDGKLGSDDSTTLYLLNVKDRRPQPIETNGRFLIDVRLTEVHAVPTVYVLLGMDENKDGKFDTETEPTTVAKLEVGTGRIVEIVDSGLLQQLQAVLDGKSP